MRNTVHPDTNIRKLMTDYQSRAESECTASPHKVSILTHHDHTRQILDKLPSGKSRFQWSLKALFAEVPIVRRNRTSKPPSITDEEDDMLFYRGYTHGLWNLISKFMERGILVVIAFLWIFFAFRLIDLQCSLRQEKAAQFISKDNVQQILSADAHLLTIFADIKWITIEGTSILSLILVLFVIRKSRKFHKHHKALHQSQLPKTPLKFAVPAGGVVFLAMIICILAHTGVIVRVGLIKDEVGQAKFRTIVFGSTVFERAVPDKSIFVLSTLPNPTPEAVLKLPATAYMQFSEGNGVLDANRQIDLENTAEKTKWMVHHVSIGFRLSFLFFLSALFPMFISPRWREVCYFHAMNLCIWSCLAVLVFVRYSSTPIAPALILAVFMIPCFLLAFSVTIVIPMVAALLYEQSQMVDKNRKDLFRWSFHEVRVPCTAILSGINMIVEDSDAVDTLSQDARNSLFDVALSTRQLSNVLNNVLEWERSSQLGMTLQCSSIRLGHLLHETLGIFSAAAKTHNFKVGVKYPSSISQFSSQQQYGNVSLFLDQQKMHHILLNMMSNSVKYARTHITVHVSILPMESCKAILNSPMAGELKTDVSLSPCTATTGKPRAADKYCAALVIQILDDGPGMSSSVLGMYSEEFGMCAGSNSGASIRNTGTGLGAHISGKMLRAHDGQLFLRSSKNVGTTVTTLVPISVSESQLKDFTTVDWRTRATDDPERFLSGTLPELWMPGLPLDSKDAVKRQQTVEKINRGSLSLNPLHNKNVLLIEDDKLVVRILERSLTKLGAQVWVAMDGCEAICMLAKTHSMDESTLAVNLATARSWEEAGWKNKGFDVETKDPLEGHVIRSAQIMTNTCFQDIQKWMDWGKELSGRPWKPHQTKVPCPQNFDLILTDMNMPQLSGLSVCATVRRWKEQKHNINTTLIGLTGNALDEDLQMFIRHGADHAMAKPLQMSLLQSFLQDRWENHDKN